MSAATRSPSQDDAEGAPEGRERHDGDDAEHGDERVVEEGAVARAEAVVDQPAQARAERQHRCRRHDERHAGDPDLEAIGPEEPEDHAQMPQIAADRAGGRGRRDGLGPGGGGFGHDGRA